MDGGGGEVLTNPVQLQKYDYILVIRAGTDYQ